MSFRNIYEETSREIANEKILKWIEKTKQLKINEFNSAANSLNHHLETILNSFLKRHTNANAESFNAKIKRFRANLIGVVDKKIFLFRLQNLFA